MRSETVVMSRGWALLRRHRAGDRPSRLRRRVRPQQAGAAQGQGDEARVGEPARVDSRRDCRRPTAGSRASSRRTRSATSGWSRAARRTRCSAAASRAIRCKAGTELVIDGYQARDHSLNRANGRNVTYPDGRKLFLGSSGTGAPTDGADPTEAPRAADAADSRPRTGFWTRLERNRRRRAEIAREDRILHLCDLRDPLRFLSL